MTASVVTDNALQLARDLIQDTLDSLPLDNIDRQLPEFTDGGMAIPALLYETACVTQGTATEPSTHLGLS